MKYAVSFVIGLFLIATASAASGMIGGGDIVFQVKGAGAVTFRHEGHVAGAGLTCTACHSGLYTTKEKRKKTNMTRMQKGQSCGACHNGMKAFSVKADCGRCHAQ